MIRKFWKAASWSNFSDHRPAIRPSTPMMPQASTANTRTHSGWVGASDTKNSATAHTHRPTARPRAIAAST
ncbi:hypothetical protein D3C85_1604560 [compost metagenome]